MKNDSIQINKEIIKKAICHYAALIRPEQLPEPIFKILSPYINPNFIEDKVLLSSERIKNHIDWDKIDKMKLIRLIIRDKFILERIDLNKHDFTLRELIPIFIMHPDLIDYFDIDFNSLSAVDAIKMLEINSAFIAKIDIGRYSYSKGEVVKILESFHDKAEIIDKLNLDTLDHYAIRTLLLKSGDKYVHKLDLSKIKALDWIEILNKKPELINHCKTSIFEIGDCFLLTKLVQILPEYDYLIQDNKDKISALGWEHLLIFDSEKYSKYCNFELLSKKNWEIIIRKHPSMTNLMHRYVL